MHRFRFRFAEKAHEARLDHTLDIGYLESGPADGPPVFLLYGFPCDARAYDQAAARLPAAGQ